MSLIHGSGAHSCCFFPNYEEESDLARRRESLGAGEKPNPGGRLQTGSPSDGKEEEDGRMEKFAVLLGKGKYIALCQSPRSTTQKGRNSVNSEARGKN